LQGIILLKVLYVSPNGYLGGAERFVLTAAKAHLTGGNVEASILFFSEGEAYKEAKNLGINCFILKKSFRFRSPHRLFLALKEIRQFVVQYKPDVLHLTMPYSHIVLSIAIFGLKIKKVWFQHGPVGGRLDRIANFLPVNMIWYNSKYLKMLHHRTWPRSRVRNGESIISLGVDSHKKIHEIFTSPVLRLGAAGRVCSGKGFHHIIIALGELKNEGSLKAYTFSIAGSANSHQDKEYAKELLGLVRIYNLTEEIKFLEHIEKMEDFYQSIDVFVHSSLVPEPFGLVVAEAMVNGCLVIGSDCGGVRDILQNGVTGIAFPSTGAKAVAIEELKKILKEILTTADTGRFTSYQEMAERGRVFIQQNYSIDQMKLQMENLYFQLIEK
jgi:glycosyltransferase involved in cell wall biosynthesis